VPLGPRPRINSLLYHGVLGPNASWRTAIRVDRPGEWTNRPPGWTACWAYVDVSQAYDDGARHA
jgi:hypothetical protein